MKDCEFLARYCTKLRNQHEKRKAEAEKEEHKDASETVRKEEIERQAKDGRIQIHVKKEEEVTVIGGGRKKNKKQRKNKKAEPEAPAQPKALAEDGALHFSLEQLNTFAAVKVEAPAKADDLPGAIEALEKAEADFEAKGIEELRKGEEKHHEEGEKPNPE